MKGFGPSGLVDRLWTRAASTGTHQTVRRNKIQQSSPNKLKDRTQPPNNCPPSHPPIPHGDLIVETELVCPTPLRSQKVCITNPAALLWRLGEQGGGFSEFFESRLRDTPPSPERPWGVIVYSDEVVPGNVLASDNRRKLWQCYMSFIEFGAEALSNELAWLPAASVRSSVVNECAAGISQLMAKLVGMWHGRSPACVDFSLAGFTVEFPSGARHRIWARFAMCLPKMGRHTN